MQALDIDIAAKRGEYKVAKWLSLSALLSLDELKALYAALHHPFCLISGQLIDAEFSKCSFDAWSQEYAIYLKSLEGTERPRMTPWILSSELSNVYAVGAGERRIIYPRYPVIQVKEHAFAVMHDGRVQSAIFGDTTIRWGMTFSFPQLFQHPETKETLEVLKEMPEKAALFRILQQWMREHTRPTPLMIGGKKVNATFRTGRELSASRFKHHDAEQAKLL